MDKTDPSGLYMCTGSAANCNAVEDRLQRAMAVQSAMKAGSDKDKLGAALQLYGKAGVANGVKR